MLAQHQSCRHGSQAHRTQQPCAVQHSRRHARVFQHRRMPLTGALGPEAPALASTMVMLSSTVITGLFWWFVVVPGERASLSKAKRRGPVKEYLAELEADESRRAERWFYTEWREQLKQRSSPGTPSDSSAQASEASGAAASQSSQEKVPPHGTNVDAGQPPKT